MIRKGQVVLRDDKLFSYIVFPHYGPYVCDCCLKMSSTLFSCAKCHMVYYCDRDCQVEAWRSHHSLECGVLVQFGILQERTDGGEKALRQRFLLLLRTILKLNFDGKFEYFEQPNGQKRYFKDLMSNKEELLNESSARTISSYHRYFNMLPIENLTYEEFLEIYGILDTNRTTIYSGELLNTTAVGIGIYLGYSAIDHSCAPNAQVHFIGKELVVRAIEDIDDFSKVRVSYLPDIATFSFVRKKLLKDSFFFDCTCPRCLDPDEEDTKLQSLKCKRCKGWVDCSSLKCSQCKEKLKLSFEELNTIEKFKKGTLALPDPSMTTRELVVMYKKYSKVFHPFHKIYDMMKIGEWTTSKFTNELEYGSEQSMTLLLETLRDFLVFLNEYYSEFNYGLGIQNVMLANVCCKLKMRDESEAYLAKAEKILLVSLGKDHPFMEEFSTIQLNIRMENMGLV